MARLYVANTTKQHHNFLAWIPESTKQYCETVRIGSQLCIGDFPLDQIDLIVKQHARYGLVPYKEIKNLRTFAGLCYSVGAPVPLEAILQGVQHNDRALDERAAERREEQAAAISDNITSAMRERGVDVPRTELTIVEDTQRGAEPKVAEGFETVKEGVAPRHGNRMSRKAQRRFTQ